MLREKYSSLYGGRRQGWLRGWSRRRKLIVGGVVLAIIIALAVGLGVGLTVGSSSGGEGSSSTSAPTVTGNATVPASIWKPENGTSWNYQLQTPPNSTTVDQVKADVWDIDLFNSNASLIEYIQNNGSKVICYFSAGSYENWRPDKDKFQQSDLGNDLDGWPGERWLNIMSSNVRSIMESRLDMAMKKGCNGVDPDNVDGYDNNNGLDLTSDDSVDYMQFLADAAFARNLSIGLKNAGAIIPSVINFMQWSVNEQCVQYNECDTYMPFIDQDKPVFHVEYPKGDNTNNNIAVSSNTYSSICDSNQAKGFSTIIKNMLLDNWIESCPDTA